MSKCKAETPAASTARTSRSKWAKSLANSDGRTAGLAARSRAFNSSRPIPLAIQVPEGVEQSNENDRLVPERGDLPTLFVLRKPSRCPDERPLNEKQWLSWPAFAETVFRTRR